MSQDSKPPEAHSGAAQSSPAPDLPDFFILIERDLIPSTNAYARDLAGKGAGEGTIVWAKAQSRGRGRHGRDWASQPGNLFMSVILRPDAAIQDAVQIGYVAALAVAETVRAGIDGSVPVSQKWPNDVLLDGKKISGILLESAVLSDGMLDWLIVGIGLNVTSHPPDSRLVATDLRCQGDTRTLADVLEGLANSFLRWYRRWQREGFEPIRTAWLDQAHARGEPMEVRQDDNAVRGTFVEIDDTGALVLKPSSGALRTIAYGDVFPPDQDAS